MIDLDARIFDARSASLDGAVVELIGGETVYDAVLRHARSRAADNGRPVRLAAHDLTRGTNDLMHVHPDGTIDPGTGRPAVNEPSTAPGLAAPPPIEAMASDAPPQTATITQTPAAPLHVAEPPPLQDFVRPVTPAPARGWRKVLHRTTGINLGLSSAEARSRELVEAVRTRAAHPEVVATICLKGGIGKTSTTAGVGLTLARYRGDRIIAIDANPDAGDLYERTCTGAPPATLTDLAANASSVQSMTDLARYAGIAERLSVIAGDQEPTISESLSAADFEVALDVVQHYYNVMMVDCGTGVTHPSMIGVLGNARHVVIAGGYAVSGARRAENSLRWLHANGYAHLARNAVVVLTQTAKVSSVVDTAAIEDSLAQLSAAVITVPHDQAVADGTNISLSALQPATADAYLQIAATIARNFH